MVKEIIQTLSEYDPIKMLTIAYTQELVDPRRNWSMKKRNLYRDILFKMLDAAHSQGIHEAVQHFQDVNFKLMAVPTAFKKTREACDLVEESQNETNNNLS